MSEYYDSLETRDAEQRERELFEALPRQLANACEHAAHYSALLDGIAPIPDQFSRSTGKLASDAQIRSCLAAKKPATVWRLVGKACRRSCPRVLIARIGV